MLKNKEITKELIVGMYFDEGLSLAKIAEKVGRAPSVIGRRFKRYGVKLRSVKEANGKKVSIEVLNDLFVKNRTSMKSAVKILNMSPATIRTKLKENGIVLMTKKDYPNKEQIESFYNEGASVEGVANSFGISLGTMRRIMYKYNIKIRSIKETWALRYSKDRSWALCGRTGRTVAPKGYIYINANTFEPEEYELFKPMMKKGNQIFEHRVVMARHLGRPLDQKEVIHHKNGVKDDNRLENLEISNPKDHSMSHKNIIRETRDQALIIENLNKEISALKQKYEKKTSSAK